MIYQKTDLPMINRMYAADENKVNNTKSVKAAEM